MTNEDQTQNDEDFDYGCECAMALLNEPTEDRLNDLIDELDAEMEVAGERPTGESSDLRPLGVRHEEQREPQVRCDDWLGESKRRSRPEVEREAGAEQNHEQH